jgi:hypothetical protein
MPNDAKLGMIVGVGMVIAIAVVFFRKDPAPAPPAPHNPAAAAVAPAQTPAASTYPSASRTVQGQTAIRSGQTIVSDQRQPVEADQTAVQP